MTYRDVLYRTADGIATITVNRPQAMNVLTYATLDELEHAFLTARDDQTIRVVILTGAGEKAFTAGFDIREIHTTLEQGSQLSRDRFARRPQRLLTLIERLGKPVIAAVNGYALGGGCEIVQVCHLAVAADTARFGQPEINLGFNPCWGGSQRLPRQVGRRQAMELILTGEMIDAREAHRIGLVNKVVPPSDLMAEAEKIARGIAAKSPVALRLCLEAMIHGMEMPLTDGLRYEAALFGMAATTEDALEGAKAFLEKRKPAFTGK